MCPRKKEISVWIRGIIRRDIKEILYIENSSFEFPWTEEDFLRCLRAKSSCMVAEHDGWIVGFMVYELHRNRIQLQNFAVHPRYRRLSVGSQMMASLIYTLSWQHRCRILLEVRETNVGAQCFFRDFGGDKMSGFEVIDIIHEFYEDTSEDAYVMEYAEEGSDAWHARQGKKMLNMLKRDFE